jgi:hypothetical protein
MPQGQALTGDSATIIEPRGPRQDAWGRDRARGLKGWTSTRSAQSADSAFQRRIMISAMTFFDITLVQSLIANYGQRPCRGNEAIRRLKLPCAKPFELKVVRR